jgi:hypothetical protein
LREEESPIRTKVVVDVEYPAGRLGVRSGMMKLHHEDLVSDEFDCTCCHYLPNACRKKDQAHISV